MKKLLFIIIFTFLLLGLQAQKAQGHSDNTLKLDSLSSYTSFKINYLLMDSIKIDVFKMEIPRTNYMVVYDHTFRMKRYYSVNYSPRLNPTSYLTLIPPGYHLNYENALNPYNASTVKDVLIMGLLNALINGY